MRLIDIDAFRKEYRMNGHCEKCERNPRECTYNGCSMMDFCDWLDDAPTVDAVPVKHGRWEDYGHCSCCGWGWSDLVYDRTEQMSRMNYCPCCGACMDLEEQDAKEET